MVYTSSRQQQIASLIVQYGPLQSSEVHSKLVEDRDHISTVTVKRELSDMVKTGILRVEGSGRSTSYQIEVLGRLFLEIDPKKYCGVEPDKRFALPSYQFQLLPSLPPTLFTSEELKRLKDATAVFTTHSQDVSPTIQHKELERLIIELSWKSSRIEGNTYTLLDTERLIRDNQEAVGHDKSESQMILNHRSAFLFIREHAHEYMTLTRANLEEVHKLLVQDMGVGYGLRSKPVGIAGSAYRPLDNTYQIKEAIDALSHAVAHESNPYEKALTALCGISYIQPFEDGNKRTSRLMANAMLLAYGLAPLSYRSVDEVDYREAMLVFYELNSLVALKKIFVEQYDFAARNYTI